MVKSGYKHVSETFQEHDTSYNSSQWNRMVELRKENSVKRMKKPTNIARARSLGYKAKQGYVIALSKVRTGTLHKLRPVMGRKNANLAVNKITPKKNLQWVAEERAAKKFPNLEVLNSYKVGYDGKKHYYEIILVDPDHPVIRSDPKVNWICDRTNNSRVYRGLTSQGKKTRGLRKKGWGAERIRPSLNANKNLH